MEVRDIIFCLLGTLILVSGLLAVTSRQIFRSAIYLLFCMIGIAGLYFWLQYEFIAAVQIVVYVGGIVVLIIFSIFLTHRVGSDLPAPEYKRTIFAGLASLFAFLLFWSVIKRNEFWGEQPSGELSVRKIGEEMLNYKQGGFVLPFEVVSILLLAAMIGCIVIAMRAQTEKN
ncbi:MAG: NADH-quinone oxidoreductase subunit J [Chitinophagales bacterium]